MNIPVFQSLRIIGIQCPLPPGDKFWKLIFSWKLLCINNRANGKTGIWAQVSRMDPIEK